MVLKKKSAKRKEGAKEKGADRAGGSGKTFNKKRLAARSDENAEIKNLEARIRADAPKAGCGAFAPANIGKDAKPESAEGGPALTSRLFKDLPISQRTLKALKDQSFTKMTEIQRGAIPHALAGRDILGEARTGSGKTLAFLVPLIELLFRARWTRLDGLGGLIVSPTRELSYQIYKVLTGIGAEHDLSAGCVVGGRELSEEQKSVSSMNILVATPGRLLQHMDESPGFDASNLQMLALDEADRILDFGFQETMNHILQQLPTQRQSMLFSATLHNSIHRLAKAALRAPEIVSVHKDALSRTPDKLKQVYMTVSLEQKLDVLFSFLRSHSQKKMIVFVSSCKQVRFLYESFRQLKPGPAIMELHGKQSLTKRMVVFDKFTEKERAVALFCTDIAARGVDFPAVDWVVQIDCPDTVDSYVHRVGRTARYQSAGSSALFLLPSEMAFIPKLKAARIDVRGISAKQGKVHTIQAKIQGVIAGDQAVKHLAQKAMISYVRSVQLMKDKEIFKAHELPLESFANSLGLAYVPEALSKVAEGADAEQSAGKKKKNLSKLERLKEKIKAKKESAAAVKASEPAQGADEESESDDGKKEAKRKLSRWERNQRRIEKQKNMPDKVQIEEEDELLVPVETPQEEAPAELSARKRKLKLGKDGVAKEAAGKHTFFAEKGGKSSTQFAQMAEEANNGKSTKASASKESRQAFLQSVSSELAQRDVGDSAVSRARIQDQHKKRRRLAKDDRRGDADDESEPEVQLGGGASASRSPSPCASDRSDSPRAFQGIAGPAKPRQAAAKPRQAAAEGERRIQASDDLGDLEKQVLSKLGGLF